MAQDPDEDRQKVLDELDAQSEAMEERHSFKEQLERALKNMKNLETEKKDKVVDDPSSVEDYDSKSSKPSKF
jgi:hypothetical protein